MAGSTISSQLQTILAKNDSELVLDETAFVRLCHQCFHNAGIAEGDRSPSALFQSLFDLDADGKLNTAEERDRFKKWLTVLVQRKSALVVVDVQNDFIDGTLSIRNGEESKDPEASIESMNRLINNVPFHMVVYTYDWHPADHISFMENIPNRQILNSPSASDNWKVGDTVHFVINGLKVQQRVWPVHCVQNTPGSQLHPRLHVISDTDRLLKIYKGQNSDLDSYSAFFDNERRGKTQLHEELTKRQITDLYICGVAYDICVAWTAQDALELGYNMAIIEECSIGLNLEDIQKVRISIQDGHGVIIGCDDVADLVNDKKLPWSWAYAAAKRLFKK